MKCYNVQNYIRYKKDIKQIVKRTDFCRPWDEMTRDELVLLFMPLAENLSRKFFLHRHFSLKFLTYYRFV